MLVSFVCKQIKQTKAYNMKGYHAHILQLEKKVFCPSYKWHLLWSSKAKSNLSKTEEQQMIKLLQLSHTFNDGHTRHTDRRMYHLTRLIFFWQFKTIYCTKIWKQKYDFTENLDTDHIHDWLTELRFYAPLDTNMANFGCYSQQSLSSEL